MAPNATLPLGTKVEALRTAAKLNPFDYQKRGASARVLSMVALQSADLNWKHAAIPELLFALKEDHTSPDLMQKLIMLDLQLGDQQSLQQASAIFEKFSKVARASPFLGIVGQPNIIQSSAKQPYVIGGGDSNAPPHPHPKLADKNRQQGSHAVAADP